MGSGNIFIVQLSFTEYSEFLRSYAQPYIFLICFTFAFLGYGAQESVIDVLHYNIKELTSKNKKRRRSKEAVSLIQKIPLIFFLMKFSTIFQEYPTKI